MERRRDVKIMCKDDFNKAFNVRLADKCCANCKYGESEFDGDATCSHPERNDNGNDCWNRKCDRKFRHYNTTQCHVCDGWEAKEGGAK